MNRRDAITLVPFLLAGCAETEKKPVEAPMAKEVPPKSGKEALYQIFPTARSWARDLQVLRIKSILLPEYAHVDGKVGGWEVTFASPSLAKTRSYRWSCKDVGTQIREGIFAGYIEDWAGPKPGAMPFAPQSLVKDSVDSWQIALKKEAKFAKENPNLYVFYECGSTVGLPNLTWQVVWCESMAKTLRRVFVDVNTGEVLRTAKV